MNELFFIIAVLGCAGLVACAGMIIVHPKRVRYFLRHPHFRSLSAARPYRVALRGWIGRHQAAARLYEARQFRNLQARFTACGHSRYQGH